MTTNVGGIYYNVTADTSELVGQTRVVERETERMAASFNAITRAVKLYAAAMAMVKTVELADQFRLLAARVEVAAGSMESGAAAMRELESISRRTQTSVEANASVFARLNQSLVQMGGTQEDTLRITELLGKAIKVSGASAVEAKAAMLQFGQALGSGKLAGDELRSLLENAPYLMRQLAEGLGVPIGALKKFGEEGKLTSDVVVNALSGAADRINADFAEFPQSFEGAMQALQDAAARANAKLDEMSGKSIVLTGITQGLSQTIDKFVDGLAGINDEAGKLNRNEAIKQWAESSRVAFSYLVDVADVTWQTLSVLGRNVAFVFTQLGADVKASAQSFVAMQKWEFTQAQSIMDQRAAAAAKARKEVDDANAKTLSREKFFGQQMRDAWDAGAGAGRGFVNPQPAPSKLKPPVAPDEKKPGAKFDAIGYLINLEEKTADTWDRINVIERDAMHKADELRKAGKISSEQYEQAKTLIAKAAAAERHKFMVDTGKREQDEARKQADENSRKSDEAVLKARKDAEDQERDAKKRAEDRSRNQTMAQDMLVAGDPVAQLELELQRKTEALKAAAEIDQENADLYAAARVALENDTLRKIKEANDKAAADRQNAQSAMLTSYGNLFGGMADMAKAFSGEQSKTYRALFAVSKAFAIADSIIKIQQGIANASALPFPMNLGAMATVAAQTASIISTIKSTQFGGGRQYGGPAMAGTLYRVNEGGRPEMFTAANGSQYMMPTADGRVTPAGDGGGSGQAWQVIINNAPAGTTASVDNSARTVTVSVAEVASQIAERRGPVWGALRSTNVQGRVS